MQVLAMARVASRILISLVTTAVAVLLGTGIAAACSCALSSVEEQVEAADVVARVLVTRVERPDDPSSAALATYTARTSTVWKGEVPAEFTFTSAAYGESCGIEGIDEGADIVLFAHGAREFSTTVCSGTAIATEELVLSVSDLLGDGVEPAAAEPVPEAPGDEEGWLLPAGIAVLAGIGVILVYTRRYLRNKAERAASDDDQS